MLPNRWAKRLKTQESAQRSLCRLGFLLFAVAPTLVIIGSWVWAIAPWSRYWSAQAWERTISLNFGVAVQIGRLENFAPNSYRFLNVTLKHPETGDSIAIIPSIEYQRRQAIWHLRLHSPVVELSQATNLVHAIHQRYLCQPNLAFPTTTCSLRGLTLMYESVAMEPIFLEAQFQCEQEKSSLQVRFDLARNLANTDGSQSARLAVERFHDVVSPRTNWLLETHALEVPCKVLAAFQPTASQLGPEATFQGDIQWEQDELNWRAALAGVFQKVQWNHGYDARPPASSKGGQVRVELAKVFNGRLVQAEGLVTAESGGNRNLADWLAAVLPSTSAVQPASHDDASVQRWPTSPGQLR